MKIAYVANVRMPTEKAHGLQIMQMCRAFSRVGHDVTLVVPKRKNWIDKSIWDFYGAEPIFKIVQVPIVDFIRFDKWLGNWGLWLTAFWFGLAARRVLEDMRPDVIYSRDEFSGLWVPRWIPHVFEAHTFPNRGYAMWRAIWKRCDRIVSVTHGLSRMFEGQGVSKEMLRVAADAVDLDQFRVAGSREETRKRLGLPLDQFLVVYAGHLYPYKGIPDLMHALPKLDAGIMAVVVGGRTDDLERTKKMVADIGAKNVILVGRVPHNDVAAYLHAADLCVMPYTRESHHVEHYSSPLKLFEYLAAGRAILSTDLPAVREILDDETAEFVPPESSEALAEGINRLRRTPERIRALEAHSSRLAIQYTWLNRAVAVIEALPKPQAEWTLTFWRRYRLELSLALLAFFVRLIYVTIFPQHPVRGGDGELYLALADHIRGLNPDPSLPIYYQPLYPMLLAVIRSVFGESLVWIRIVQAAMSASTVFLLAVIARRWATPYAAWIAGLFGALYVPSILESGILYTETTYTFLLTLAVLAFLAMLDSKRGRDTLLAGAAFALAGLAREIIIYLLPVLAVVAAWWKKSAKTAILLLLPVMLMVIVTSVHNHLVAGDTVANYVPLVSKRYDQAIAEPDFQKLALFTPSRWVMYPEGVFIYFRFPFRLLDISTDVSVKQAILTGNWPLIRSAMTDVAVKGFLVLFHWFLLAMAVLGFWKGKITRQAKIAMAVIILYAMITIVVRCVGHIHGFAAFEPLARYRFPTEPLILVLAAAGIERLSRVREEKN